jgi:hypothetical protein
VKAEEKKKKIFKKLRILFGSLVSGSGHLASYTLDYNTFRITGTEDISGNTKYSFTVNGFYLSEFTEYTEDTEEISETLNGSIILDKDLEYTRDDSGNIALSPWKCLDPDKYKSEKHDKKDKPRKSGENKKSGRLSSKEIERLLRGIDD